MRSTRYCAPLPTIPRPPDTLLVHVHHVDFVVHARVRHASTRQAEQQAKHSPVHVPLPVGIRLREAARSRTGRTACLAQRRRRTPTSTPERRSWHIQRRLPPARPRMRAFLHFGNASPSKGTQSRRVYGCKFASSRSRGGRTRPVSPLRRPTTALGVITPSLGLPTLHAHRPPTRLRPAVHRQPSAGTRTPMLAFPPRRVVGDPTMRNPPTNSIGVVVCVSP